MLHDYGAFVATCAVAAVAAAAVLSTSDGSDEYPCNLTDVFPIPAIVSLENLASLSYACQNQVIILSSIVASGVKTFLVFLTNLHTLNRNSLYL